MENSIYMEITLVRALSWFSESWFTSISLCVKYLVPKELVNTTLVPYLNSSSTCGLKHIVCPWTLYISFLLNKYYNRVLLKSGSFETGGCRGMTISCHIPWLISALILISPRRQLSIISEFLEAIAPKVLIPLTGRVRVQPVWSQDRSQDISISPKFFQW